MAGAAAWAHAGEEWEIRLTAEVESFLDDLYESDPASHQLVNQAILILERNGPAEGRPLVDSITASRIANMKELRPPSSGRSEIRILLVFDRGGRRSCWWQGTSQGSGTSGTGRPFPVRSGCTTITLLSGGKRWGHERRVTLAGLRVPRAGIGALNGLGLLAALVPRPHATKELPFHAVKELILESQRVAKNASKET